MARDHWQTDDSGFEIPLTPLVDIIFNLIIFFLVATTFYSEERDLKIRLPEGTHGDALTQEGSLYVINVRDSGVIVVGTTLMSLEQLDQELAKLATQRRPKVEVRGDTNARHGQIMAVMNLCRKHGISEYSLTQRIVKDVR
jgi:biopolymer transport protein ExbD